MADPSNDPTPEPIRPAAEILPEVYAELRRLAAALTGQLAARPDASADRPGPRGLPAPGEEP